MSGPGVTSARWMRNKPIIVPSSDGYSIWLTVRPPVSSADSAVASHGVTAPSAPSRTSRVGDENESTTANRSAAVLLGAVPRIVTASPMPVTVESGRGRPSASSRWTVSTAASLVIITRPAAVTAIALITSWRSATSVSHDSGPAPSRSSSGIRTTRLRGASWSVTPTNDRPSAENPTSV